MEKNKTYEVWRILAEKPSMNECIHLGRIRDCKKYLEVVEAAYRDIGWKIIATDRTLMVLPTIEAGVEYIYIITENVSGDVELIWNLKCEEE